jgi:hypothetical protein
MAVSVGVTSTTGGLIASVGCGKLGVEVGSRIGSTSGATVGVKTGKRRVAVGRSQRVGVEVKS